MKCLVLGGSGFIGSHVCDRLLDAQHEVKVFLRPDGNKKNLSHLQDRIEFYEGDFSSPEHLQAAVDGVDYIFHFISATLPKSSNEDMVYDINANVISTLHLLEAARKAGVKKVIYASSGGTVYGIPKCSPIPEDHPTDPVCSYGIHKVAIEKYLALYHHLYGLDYAVMRISNPYGNRQNVKGSQGAVAVFLYKALLGEPIEIWGDGTVVRDYLHVSDVAEASLQLMRGSLPSKIYNVGSGIGLSLNEIVEEIRGVLDRQVEVRYKQARSLDVPINVLDITRSLTELDWKPKIRFSDGLRHMAEDLRKQYFV